MGYIYGVKYTGDKTVLEGRSKSLLSSKYCYIGQAINYERRWNTEKREVHNGNHNSVFYDTIRHHGIDKFEWIVILIVNDEIMGIVEDDYIHKYSLYPNGLNLKGGGFHGKFTEELCNKLSKIHKERFKSIEIRERNRLAQIKARQNNPDLKNKDRQAQLDYNATDAGKLKAKIHSDYMKLDTPKRKDEISRMAETKRKENQTEEGKVRIAEWKERMKEWRETPAGIKYREEQSTRAKKQVERGKALIPQRRCDVCNYEPPNNNKPKFDRHLATQKHKANENKSLGSI
jgi:hypothetical protein